MGEEVPVNVEQGLAERLEEDGPEEGTGVGGCV
jgi:hypothetical protein